MLIPQFSGDEDKDVGFTIILGGGGRGGCESA